MTRKLSPDEYQAVVSAINKEPYDKNVFKRAIQKMNMCSGIRPDWVEYEDFPWLLTEWRRDKEWSLAHLDRHQAGCDAMWEAYWGAFKK